MRDRTKGGFGEQLGKLEPTTWTPGLLPTGVVLLCARNHSRKTRKRARPPESKHERRSVFKWSFFARLSTLKSHKDIYTYSYKINDSFEIEAMTRGHSMDWGRKALRFLSFSVGYLAHWLCSSLGAL